MCIRDSAMGATGPFSALITAFGLIGFLMLPIVILVSWSRIELKCHTLSQVIAGILLAFASTYIQMTLILKYFGT